MSKEGKVAITYKYIDGAHFFVSSDKAAEGFCVAHADLKTAFYEVANQLNALFKFNHKVPNPSFKPGVSFETFQKLIDGYTALTKGTEGADDVMPASVQPWMLNEARV